jgi:sugar lactone lactonase YvrE
MNAKSLNALLIALVICFGWSIASAQSPFPANATFTTLATTPLAIEGLTGDNSGNLYTVGRNGAPCPVWKINIANPPVPPAEPVVVGNIPAPCAPLGLAFNKAGDLFVADGDRILFFTPNAVSPPTADVYATGVLGTNGLAFDSHGNLWTGDGGAGGGTGFGRVWKITGRGADCASEHLCQEVFRIQPMNNGSTFGGAVPLNPGVGRVNATMQPNGTPANNPQNLVVNGLAFNTEGDLFIADTARGALWQVKFKPDGTLQSHVGCDETFHPNTLCLNHVFSVDPRLEGADGIALDQDGNIWVSVNERNAIAIFGKGVSAEVFRNPVNSSGLRNSADNAIGNTHILEFPTSPFLSGTKFCTANSDNNRRDNSPNMAGEVNSSGPVGLRGKISCMVQDLTSPGLPLPR